VHQYIEDLGLRSESRLVEPVGHDVEDVGEHAHVVPRVELVGDG
jgi:hypothetical protein